MYGIKKTPLPPLEDLAEAVTVLLHVGLQQHKEPRKELKKILQAEGATKEWFPETHGPLLKGLANQCTPRSRRRDDSGQNSGPRRG